MRTAPSASTSTRSKEPRSLTPRAPTSTVTSNGCSLATNARSGRVECQTRKRRIASLAAARSARDCHAASKPRSAQTESILSSRTSGSAGSSSRATESARTWTIDPKPSAVERATSACTS